MIPFSVERPSAGSPSTCHLRSSTGPAITLMMLAPSVCGTLRLTVQMISAAQRALAKGEEKATTVEKESLRKMARGRLAVHGGSGDEGDKGEAAAHGRWRSAACAVSVR